MHKEAMENFRKNLEACMRDPTDSQVSGSGGFFLKNGKKFNPAVVAEEFANFFLIFSVEAMKELDAFYSQVDEENFKSKDDLHTWKQHAIVWGLQAVRDKFKEKYKRLDPYVE